MFSTTYENIKNFVYIFEKRNKFKFQAQVDIYKPYMIDPKCFLVYFYTHTHRLEN